MSGRTRSRAARLAQQWVEAFPDFLAQVSPGGPLREMRSQAMAAFGEQGLPHRKLEGWRHTPLGPIEEASPSPPVAEAAVPEPDISTRLATLAQPSAEALDRAVFVDGRFSQTLSSLARSDSGPLCQDFEEALADPEQGPQWLARLGSLADPKRNAFTALSTAYMQGGAVIRLPSSCRTDRPLHLLFVWTRHRNLTCPRILVHAESGSEAVVLVEHVSLGKPDLLINDVSELLLAPEARLEWVVLERPEDSALRVSNLYCQQQRDSRLDLHMLSLGGRFARTDIAVRLADTGAEVKLHGLFVGTSDRVVDHHTEIDHAMPHGRSQQLYKGILTDRSRGVFQGMIRVCPHAQKTNSKLSNSNLLLSEHAQVEAEPQLEIHADDVQCSHGSTVGQLDPEALYYLQSRGIGIQEAREILTRGFANEVCDPLPNKSLREFARSLVSERLTQSPTPGMEP